MCDNTNVTLLHKALQPFSYLMTMLKLQTISASLSSCCEHVFDKRETKLTINRVTEGFHREYLPGNIVIMIKYSM